MSGSSRPGTEVRAIFAGVLAWVVPGLGHFYLGQHWRGALFLAVITTTFWGGVAIGGVRSTVDPANHRAWFVAELCTAGHTGLGLILRSRLSDRGGNPGPGQVATWPADDIGIVYCGVAGLLNVLVILDAAARGAGSGPRPQAARSPPGRRRDT